MHHRLMKFLHLAIVTLLLMLAPKPLRAQPRPAPKAAVLQLKVQGKAVALDDAAALTDTVRTHLVDIADARLKVISKEKVFEILQQSGKSATQCTAECEIQTAREVGADYVLTGTIRQIGKTLLVLLEVRGASDGSILAAREVEVPNAEQLHGKVGTLTDEVVNKLLARIAKPESEAPKPVVCPSGARLVAGKCVAEQVACPAETQWDAQRGVCVGTAAVAAPVRVASVQSAPRACAGERGKDCWDTGNDYYYARGVARDYLAASRWYFAACEAADMRGCSDVGFVYRDGLGVAKDLDRANQFFRQACDGANAFGCRLLGWSHEAGLGVAKDSSRAAQLYKQACDGGDNSACNNLGNSFWKGFGVAKDFSRAAQLYKQACTGGDNYGCGNLGYVMCAGQGVPIDKAGGSALMTKACKDGMQYACDNAAVCR